MKNGKETENPFLIRKGLKRNNKTLPDDYTAADFDDLSLHATSDEPTTSIVSLSAQAIEIHKKLGGLIKDLMADHESSDHSFVSNMRMFFQIALDDKSDELKKALVINFPGYYCQTLFNECPDDVLTRHSLEAKVQMNIALDSNPNQTLN